MSKPSETNKSAAAEPTDDTGSIPTAIPTLFDEILEARSTKPAWPLGVPFVVICTDARHPTLQGRVQIRWDGDGTRGAGLHWWVPTLHGLAIRAGDRLLAQMPEGGPDPIVIGVVDGFADRPEPARTVAARLEVKKDEVLQICSQEGQPLVEIVQDDKGPMVRLLQSETRVDVKGKLSITAAELELTALKGKIRLEAADDIEAVGEVIHLN